MRPAALCSPGHTAPEDERPIVVKLEEEEEATPWDPSPEAACWCFWHFRYEEEAGPGEALARLRKLCHQWLRPEVHSKEQMLELLVLEQFLSTLPPKIQARVRGQRPGNPEEAVALVEGLRREPGGPRRWVTVQVQGQEVLSEKVEPSDFQSLPQTKPQTTEPRPETEVTTQRSPPSPQVKKEPEDPAEDRQEFLDSEAPVNPQEAASTLLPEAQDCGMLLDQASPHSKTEPEGSSWREHPGALWNEEAGGITSPAASPTSVTPPRLGLCSPAHTSRLWHPVAKPECRHREDQEWQGQVSRRGAGSTAGVTPSPRCLPGHSA